MNIIEQGNSWLIDDGIIAGIFQTTSDPRNTKEENHKTDSLDWGKSTLRLEDFVIFPFGDLNNLPIEIRNVISQNYLMPGLFTEKRNLLWGQGPVLYRNKVIDNQMTRELIEDGEVLSWLESFDYRDQVLACIEDYNVMESVSVFMNRSRGFRLGKKGFISSVEHIAIDDVRLGARYGSRFHAKRKPTHAIVENYNDSTSFGLNTFSEIYPLFDNKNPFAYPTTVFYSNLYSFAIDVYSLPDIYGALDWLNISSKTPLILNAFINDSINLKFHIESPQTYWDKVEEKIKEACHSKNETYDASMLKSYRKRLFKQITEVLSGAIKAGKMLHTVTLYDTDGNNVKEMGWKINVIDQKTKDFVESQIKISQRADHAVSASANINATLGNISESGGVNSGSEKLYAYQKHIKTNISIPEYVVFKPFNMAIKHNFPNKNILLGFHHETMMRSQDINPKERFTETI